MKKSALILVLFVAGCANGTPIDIIWPAVVPFGAEAYLQHDMPNYKGITTLAIVKASRHEVEYRRMLNNAQYAIVNKTIPAAINTSEKGFSGLMAGIALCTGAGAPLAFLAGSKRKRKGDFSPEEVQTEVVKAGLQDPEEFKKSIT